MTTADGGEGPPGGAEVGRVVALGGGHGLAVTLRAALHYAVSITAVVSVADDGGSSGRLRDELGIAPPGDLRRCLSALAHPGSPLGAALEHRFEQGDLAGHAVGNVLLAGLADSSGDFVAACDEVGRLVGARGRVLPVSTEPITLNGFTVVGSVSGQIAVQNSGGVRSVELDPPDPSVPTAVLDAIAEADQVVLGPGSLYTSVLAAALVPRVRKALRDTTAQKVYVCNLGPQDPETTAHGALDHLHALQRHDVPVDVMVCHPGSFGDLPIDEAAHPVRVVEMVVSRTDGTAHDPAMLAEALLTCFHTDLLPEGG
jgi:uncharacterized cofD-like protein